MTERDIFLVALDIVSREERDAFLADACSEPGQKERLQALLEAEAKLGTFLESPARPPEPSRAEEEPDRVISGYKLLEQIGEGGMGAVWMAEQSHPVRRKVALKIIKPGMDSRQVIARFEAERQALALMEHPNIAHVFDGGTTASGRPFFVMELVRGVPITEFCDRNRLDPEARLKLFVTVCRAIQHAHQKGIIHRDIKPSNVMVTLNDGQPVAKVIDFGIAKATGQTLTERTCFTAYGEMIGTPAYMSPEQAEMTAVDVDTRSDIYSLGVLLYELMTGTTPIDNARLDTVAFSEIQRMIREVTPPRPSARLSTLGEKATILADNRGTDRTRLVKLLAGDLDWIMMKALEKERDRRYATAGEFAADLEHFLRYEAVLARPPSKMYRVMTFVRRHRAGAGAVSVAVATLLAATAIATWHAVVATRAETKARDAQKVAQSAGRRAVTNLYHALVEGAAALRRARDMGYRAQVFNRLQQAARLDTPDKDTDRLRQEAIACLGDFVGLDPITWDDFPADVRDVAITPDGRQVAVALDNGTIQVRDVRTGDVIGQRSESAIAMRIDPSNRWLVTAGAGGTIKVWQDYGTAPGPALHTVPMRADFAGMARNGRFAIGSSAQEDGGRLSVWDVAHQEVKARLKVPPGVPRGPIQVSDDGQTVAQAYDRKGKLFALVWNTSNPEPRAIPFAETHQETAALAISADGRFLACSRGDDGLVLVDLHDSVPRPLIRADQVTFACFSPDGQFLFHGTLSGRIGMYRVSYHEQLGTLSHIGNGAKWEAYSAAFSADGTTFATGARPSRSVRVWKLTGSGEKMVLAGHDGGVPCVAFSPDGKALATGSKDGSVKIWDTVNGQLTRTMPHFESAVQSVAFSPDGRLLAVGQFGKVLKPLQVLDMIAENTFIPADDALGRWATAVAFSPDGKFLAACGDGLTIWRVARGQGDASGVSFKRTVHLPGRRSLYLRISPDGQLLAWVDHNYCICLWDLANGREIPFLGPPVFGWHSLAFFPDSQHLTFCSARGMVETWDTRTGTRVSTLGRGGSGIAASPDCRWLLSAADPYSDSLWNAETGSRVFLLPPEHSAIWARALSGDNQRLALGLVDGGLVIWNVPRIQDQLTQAGLAWDPSAQRPTPQVPQPFVPATPREQQHLVEHDVHLGTRLASVARLQEAEAAYRSALKLQRDDPVAQKELGRCLEDQGRYSEAEVHLNEAIRLRPDDGGLRVLRGWVYADREQWAKASADFVKATECGELDPNAWYSRALLALRNGDLDGYRAVCADMLRRFGTAATWTCTLAPDCGADPARIVALANSSFTEGSRDHWRVNQLGAALYRAGRFEDAVKALTEASELSADPHPTNMLCTWLYLAMAHHRLGHADPARHWFDRARQGTEDALKSSGETGSDSANADGVIPANWPRKWTFQWLRREAENLIQRPDATSGK